jgi:hypothetical protein
VQASQWDAALREAGAVEWKPALRAALLLAVPAGLIFGGTSFLGLVGLVWIAAAAAWAVTLYVRGQRAAQRPVWMTAGAGARIGLVTGLITGWIAFAASGALLYVERFVFHGGKEMDDLVQAQAGKLLEQVQALNASPDTQAAAAFFKSIVAWLLTPEGRAGSTFGGLVIVEFVLVVFAMAGGALGAKLMTKKGTREQG